MTREEINDFCEMKSQLEPENEDIFNYIIKALEQEPMQVELTGDGYADGKLVYDYGTCPECGWTFEEDDKDWEERYCCHCGQKLKWFDKKEGEE